MSFEAQEYSASITLNLSMGERLDLARGYPPSGVKRLSIVQCMLNVRDTMRVIEKNLSMPFYARNFLWNKMKVEE